MVVVEELRPYPIAGEDIQDERRQKLEMIRVKFLRIARRLGQMPCNLVVAQVLYRLGLLDPLMIHNQEYALNNNIIDRANLMAEQLEAAAGHEAPLDFSCTILVLGKTGVGKTATINSIFDTKEKLATNAFHRCTREVQEVRGTVHGIKIRVIDTPGLLPCWSEQHHNKRILTSVNHFIKKTPPDVVLYVDRLDLPSGTGSDGSLLRDITDVLGASIWCDKAIIVLTHAASDPSDGPKGSALSYDMFVARQSHALQQAVGEAAGDVRLTVPVSLVENNHQHCVSACETNGHHAMLLTRMWRPHLLLLSFASKILVEATSTLLSGKLQDAPHRPSFAFRLRVYRFRRLYQCLCNPVSHDLYHQVHCPFQSQSETVGSTSWQLGEIPGSWEGEDDEVFRRGIDARKSYVAANQKVQGWLHSQVLKDKKHAFLKMETVTEIKHGGGTGTSVMYDVNYIKTTSKQGLLYKGGRWKNVLSCKLMTDTRFINQKRHNANAGLLCCVDGNAVMTGLAVREQIIVNDQFNMLVCGCAMATPSDGIHCGGYLTAIYKWSSSAFVRLWLQFEPGKATNLGECCDIASMIPLGRHSKMHLYCSSRGISTDWRTSKYPEVALLLFIPAIQRLLGQAKQRLVMQMLPV